MIKTVEITLLNNETDENPRKDKSSTKRNRVYKAFYVHCAASIIPKKEDLIKYIY